MCRAPSRRVSARHAAVSAAIRALGLPERNRLTPAYLEEARRHLVEHGVPNAATASPRTLRRWLRTAPALQRPQRSPEKSKFGGRRGRREPLSPVVYCQTDLEMQDKPAAFNAAVLRQLATAKCSTSVRTLVLNTPNFDVECVRALVALLKARPKLFALNFGEKTKLGTEGWRLLLGALETPGQTGVVSIFVDVVDTGGKKANASDRRAKPPAQWGLVDKLCEAALQNRLRLEAAAARLRTPPPRARGRRLKHVKCMGKEVGLNRARALCPWRDKSAMHELCAAARDGSTLNHAFGKTFWQPGVGLKTGQQWKWW